MGARCEDTSERPPTPGEVAVQIDAVCVLAPVGDVSVRVENGDDPEVDVVRRSVLETAGDRDSGGLVAVDAADDEDFPCAVEVSRLDGDDRAALDGAAEGDGAAAERVRPLAG